MYIVAFVIGVVLGPTAGFYLGAWYCKNVKGMK